jgi:hypothetical protein
MSNKYIPSPIGWEKVAQPDEGKYATALAGKAVRITTHDDGLIKNANGHIEAGPMPDLPSQPELGLAQSRL